MFLQVDFPKSFRMSFLSQVSKNGSTRLHESVAQLYRLLALSRSASSRQPPAHPRRRHPAAADDAADVPEAIAVTPDDGCAYVRAGRHAWADQADVLENRTVAPPPPRPTPTRPAGPRGLGDSDEEAAEAAATA